jgi:hypothetical protein
MSSPVHFDRHENPPFARDSHGALVLRFHSDGGPVVFTGQTHQDFPGGAPGALTDRPRPRPPVLHGRRARARLVRAGTGGGLTLGTLAVVGLVSILLAG